MSLKDLLQNEKKVNHIRIKILEIEENHVVVGDQSSVAICCTHDANFKNLTKGNFYLLVKPIKMDENTFIPNEKLKPVNISEFSLPARTKEVQKLVNLIKTKSTPNTKFNADMLDNLKTFQEILQLPTKSEIKSVTVKVIAISKDIAGNYGTYNIGKVKDKLGEKMDINLYNKQVKKKFKRGDIINLTNLKITEYTKTGETLKRLATTARSSAYQCGTDIEILFKNIPLGDEKNGGIVLAIHDIFSYLSCSKCWKKTNESDEICQCGNTEDIKVIDFHCQFYIQIDKDDDVKIVHTFRRQTGLILESENRDDIQKMLDDKFVDKHFSFEWNINLEDEELRMVEIMEGEEIKE